MPIRIAVIDDEQNMRHMLMSLLTRQGYEVSALANGAAAVEFCALHTVDVVLCDLRMPGMSGIEVLSRLREGNETLPIIMMSAFATVDTAVEAMRLGAWNFITKPFKSEEILRTLEKAVEVGELKRENVELRNRVAELSGEKGDAFSTIIGESGVLHSLKEQARKVAEYNTTVLITGESGTGKELFARGLHRESGARAGGELLSVNCGSIPAELLEAEFFGHLKGAFTGANESRDGIFVAAQGGTVFLDEIGELPLDLQVKLLRVLQEREVRPVGSNVVQPVDVRVVAATARNLSEMVAEGKFRQDLLYRLNVIELHLPPLRERREDIPLLLQHFIRRFNRRFERQDCPVKRVAREALTGLLRYSWPGNVRELENAVEHAFVYCNGDELRGEDFPARTREAEAAGGCANGGFAEVYSLKEGKKLLERQFILKALEATGGNKTQAAEILELSYPSLLAKIREIEKQGGD